VRGPAHRDEVSDYAAAIGRGKFEEAYRVMRDSTPLWRFADTYAIIPARKPAQGQGG